MLKTCPREVFRSCELLFPSQPDPYLDHFRQRLLQKPLARLARNDPLAIWVEIDIEYSPAGHILASSPPTIYGLGMDSKWKKLTS